MGRHALRRGRLAAAASATTLGLLAALVPLFVDSSAGRAQAAEATAEIVLEHPNSTSPRDERLLAAGTTGFLRHEQDRPGLVWTDYTTGKDTTVRTGEGVYAPVKPCAPVGWTCYGGWYGQGADTVALPAEGATAPSVQLWDPATHRSRTVTSARAPYVATYGDTVITRDSVIDFVDGAQRERAFSGEVLRIDADLPRVGDRDGVLLESGSTVFYLDLASATLTRVFDAVADAARLVLTGDRIGWYAPGWGLHVKSRGDLTADEKHYDVGAGFPATVQAALSGDWLLLQPEEGLGSATDVTAVSLADGTPHALLPKSYGNPLPTPDGDVLVTGGTGGDDWWVWRFGQAADGSPRLTKVVKVAPYENPKLGLALSRGRLRVAESADGGTTVRSGTWALSAVSGTLTASARAAGDNLVGAACPYGANGVRCALVWGDSGVEGDVVLGTGNVLRTLDDAPESSSPVLDFHAGAGRVVDVSDRWAVYDSSGTSPAQYVGEFGQGQLLKRGVRAAALNGSTLWSPGTAAGQLTSYSLTESRTLSTVSVGAPCVPSELQAAGAWVYWSCGDSGPAGVYGVRTGKSVPVAPGDVLLGDGYTVRHDHAAGTLVLTDAASGATRVLTDQVADSGLAVDRRYRFVVDEYAGLVAWVDPRQQVHVATAGVAPSALGLYAASADTDVDAKNSLYSQWNASWLLSRPVSSWSLTFTSPQAKVLRTLTGGATTAQVSVAWDGRTASGAYVPNGTFTWNLRATPLGTSSTVTVASGSARMSGGAAVARDYGGPGGKPDGVGDLLSLDSSGRLTYRLGKASTGTFSGTVIGAGWATTVKAVPVGDLSGDRCNDVIVRLSSGSLRLYKPACGKAVTPSTTYTSLGTGWNQYDVLTSPGDVSGDGRPDLLARKASDGDIYLYKGTSAGKLSARVKLYDNWKVYKKIVGAGDLNGDGHGDILMQDTSNELWRRNGTGKGTFGARVKVADNWGSSYNVLVGVGDVTGDGKADLVARDTSGVLWRYNGGGTGSFGGRAKIGTGYKGYKGLY